MLTDKFVNRHIGPRESELPQMLKTIEVSSLDELIEKTVPSSILLERPLRLPEAMSEFEYLIILRLSDERIKCSVLSSGRATMEWLSYR